MTFLAMERRNFSNSLLRALLEGSEEAPSRSKELTNRPDCLGVEACSSPESPRIPINRVSSFSALASIATPEGKSRAREAKHTSAEYTSHNIDVPVVIVTSEIAPWSRTGGLALVASSYSYEFSVRGHRTMVVTPMYAEYSECEHVDTIWVYLDGNHHEVCLYHRCVDFSGGHSCDMVFVHAKNGCYRRRGIYDDDGREFDDNLFRFSLLCLAALEAPLVLKLHGNAYGDKCVFLANDWQAGLVPVYMCHKYRNNGTYLQSRVLFVIHNLGYQGQYKRRFNLGHFFGIPPAACEDIVHGDGLNLSKGALLCADRIVTVSPNYAMEIQTREGGFGMDSFVRARAAQQRVAGIANGIDDAWDPSVDTEIKVQYSVDEVKEAKKTCKVHLQQRLHLQVDDGVLIGFVGRLTSQKGVDLFADMVPWLMEDTGNGVTGRAQLIMMGCGDRQLSEMLRRFENQYPRRVCGYAGFDASVERDMMAGCDLLLMPSRYEPCGLPQMYCQVYGTLPIVTSTGGLKDSVIPHERGTAMATGFQIHPLTAAKLKEIVYVAVELCIHRPEEFLRMQRNAMRRNFYWPASIDKYEEQIDYALCEAAVVR
uniref:Starch synthase catalytic domain-containing protein n=1 Tax=Noctiluca scintillans TaxID=2966 RepID=A0A7S1A9Q6_NOCSC|mmetsp:Transcript_37565/g.99861  ORF Transcript_37565/g.99861 Transcript_37565/m.99861 type:complete len:595 (+) Transcript_37565:56-1840(+)